MKEQVENKPHYNIVTLQEGKANLVVVSGVSLHAKSCFVKGPEGIQKGDLDVNKRKTPDRRPRKNGKKSLPSTGRDQKAPN